MKDQNSDHKEEFSNAAHSSRNDVRSLCLLTGVGATGIAVLMAVFSVVVHFRFKASGIAEEPAIWASSKGSHFEMNMDEVGAAATLIVASMGLCLLHKFRALGRDEVVVLPPPPDMPDP